jgi:hypothetical protein
MKSLVAIAVLGGAILVMAGCAFHEHPVVLGTVGPAAAQPSFAGPKGTLVVYSAYDPNAEFNDLPYLRRYTDYKVLAESGKLLETIHNNKADLVEGPQNVELPAGKYRIVARANGYRTVIVPVVIMADQLTTVHLEGGASWPDNPALVESHPVRLPNGEIVGWRANTETFSQR